MLLAAVQHVKEQHGDVIGRNTLSATVIQRRLRGGAAYGQVDGVWLTGRMAVVLPQGALFRKGVEDSIRQRLLEMDLIDAVIGLAPVKVRKHGACFLWPARHPPVFRVRAIRTPKAR